MALAPIVAVALTIITASSGHVSPAVAAAVGRLDAAAQAPGIHKIKHVVIIMQENRSFDTYFGTYPGADGIPRNKNGKFTPASPDPARTTASSPTYDTSDIQGGGPHMYADAVTDINRGKMDGFIRSRESGHLDTDLLGCAAKQLPSTCDDVMGYHNGKQLKHYWAYAKNFVLQDHMFEPNIGWSQVSHLYMVSGWSAKCKPNKPMSCKHRPAQPGPEPPERQSDARACRRSTT